MRIFMRTIIAVLGLVLALIVCAVLYLTLVLDPNDFKGDIERLAKAQGLPLSIHGDLSWRWFPQLGLSVEGVEVGAGREVLLRAERMATDVAIEPLFSGQVSIAALEFQGVQVNLHKNAQGVGNWEALQSAAAGDTAGKAPTVGPASTAPSATGPDAATPVSLVVEQLRLSDTQVVYRDDTQSSTITLDALSLSIDGLDITGKPFQWQQSAMVRMSGQPDLLLRSNGTVAVDLNSQQVVLDTMAVSVSVNDTPLKLSLAGELSLDDLAAKIQLNMARLNLAQWLTQWGLSLPEMSAADALSNVAFAARINGDPSLWRLDDITLNVDDSSFAGHASLAESGALALVLNGDRLDADRYLPMAKPEASSAVAAPKAGANSAPSGKSSAPSVSLAAAKLSDEPVDLSALRDLDASLVLTLSQLVLQELPLEDVALNVTAKSGVVTVSKLTAAIVPAKDSARGLLDLTASVDARRDDAKITAKAKLTNLALKPLLDRTADDNHLSGIADASVSMTTKGRSLYDWQQQLNADVALQAQQLIMAELDIERSACELAALVNRKPSPALDWKGHTQLDDVSAKLRVKGERVLLDSVSAGVENLQVKARGELNYVTGRFEVPLDVAFVGAADTKRDCQVRDRWRNRDLPLRCEGTLDTVSARTCLPDRKRIDDLLRDELGDEASEKLKEKLQEKLGDEDAQAVEQLLRGLFKRK